MFNELRPSRITDLILPIGMITSVLVIMVPLPAPLMDILLAINITASVIMLLTTIYVRTPLELSIFPTLLLASTLGRLVLNVATTRLILTRAQTHGLDAAGGVIRSFSDFVAGDRVVVGLIIFVIIVVIQFVVITKGATRISEVTARFALDGMPGKQMAIDADLNAGAIDEQQAQERRAEITRQADFYAAMDGASKFVRGDAIAGIVITLINVVGGLFIGTIESGMGISEAASLFTRLSIGDGLVSQVPAFLVSIAAGLLITRSTNSTNLPREFLDQLFSRPQPLAVAGGFLGVLMLTNLPTVPLLSLGSACVGCALMLTRKEKAAEVTAQKEEKKAAEKPPEERIEDFLAVDPMEIEVGVGLIRLADPKRGGDLLERIHRVRQTMAADIGIIMPKVRIRDNFRLEQHQYRIRIGGLPVDEGTLMPGRLLAIDSPLTTGKVPGIETQDPVFKTPAVWIEPGQRDRAEMLGYRVVEPTAVLATHLTDIVRRHADELLTRDATKHLVDELKTSSPAVVEELIPKQLSLAEVQNILQLLLREEVPIRQLALILETLGDFAARTQKDPVLLTENVRNRLARAICSRYRDGQNRLHVVTLSPSLEDAIRQGLQLTGGGIHVQMSPDNVRSVCQQIAKEVDKLKRNNWPPVVLVSPQIRAGLKQMTHSNLPRLVVLSYNEITRDTVVEPVGNVAEASARDQANNT